MNNSVVNSTQTWSDSPLVYIALPGSLLGTVSYLLWPYFIIHQLKLNNLIKAILIVLTFQYLFGYISIFSGLILMLFFKAGHVALACNMLSYPLIFNALWLQTNSALISICRLYMGFMTSKNRAVFSVTCESKNYTAHQNKTSKV